MEEELEFEELYVLESWETSNRIKYNGKTLFTREEAFDIFHNKLTKQEQEEYRLSSQEKDR